MSAATVTITNPNSPVLAIEELPNLVVKVFSATMAKVRDELGTVVTDWLAAQQGKIVVDHFVVSQSSDQEFHCLSITVFAHRVGSGRKS